MKFELEVLDARRGDCLIVNYAEEDEVHRILIDGGFHQVYETRLRPRLVEIRDEIGADAPVEFELAMLSHIDEDHIIGLIKLTDEILATSSGPESPAIIKRFWNNTFSKLTDDNELASLSIASDEITTANATGAPIPFDFLNDENSDGRAAHILASIGQGDDLSRNIAMLGLDGNQPFDQGIVLSGNTENIKGMDFKILGPSLIRLNALREEWDPGSDPIVLAKITDRAVANLSSIIVLMKFAGKTILSTGDARGDDVIDGLTEAGLIVDGTCKVDVIKLPHHASSRNVDENFFNTVLADIYICSADGKHDNPDQETLQMLREARNGESYTVIFSNEMVMQHPEKQPAFDAEVQKLKDAGVTIETRDPNKHSIIIKLI